MRVTIAARSDTQIPVLKCITPGIFVAPIVIKTKTNENKKN
jgi:hypothetical protein